MDIQDFIDDVFFQEEICIAYQVVQGDFQGFSDGGGDLDGGLDFVAFIAADDSAMDISLYQTTNLDDLQQALKHHHPLK